MQCIEQSCQPELNACRDEREFCDDYLRDRTELKQPYITALDLQARGWRASWDRDHGESERYTPLVDLRDCAARSCDAECALGRDLSCVGNFSYPASPRPVTRAKVRLLNGANGLSHWMVSVCPGEGCPQTLADAATDEGGFAVLDVDFRKGTSTIPVNLEQTNYFAFVGPDEYEPYDVWLSLPLYQDSYVRLFAWSRAMQQDVAQLLAQEGPDERRGHLGVVLYDCQGESMRDVRVELWQFGANAQPHQCEACSLIYARGDGFPDPALRQVATNGGASAYANGFGPMTVVGREVATQRVVAVRPLSLLGGHQVGVLLYPASREQLSELPDAILHPEAR
jgi:hypothetical protein